jgi:hypothetical protein
MGHPAVLFLFTGLISTLTMGIKSCLRCLTEVVEAFYEFKAQCVNSKQRYERAIEKHSG